MEGRCGRRTGAAFSGMPSNDPMPRWQPLLAVVCRTAEYQCFLVWQQLHDRAAPGEADIQAGSTMTTWLANTCWDLQHEGETHPRRASSRHRRVLATQSDEVELSHDGRRRDGEQMEDSEEQGTRGHQHRAPRRQNHGADRRGGSKCPSEQGGGSGRRLGAELARPPEALSAQRPCRQRGLVGKEAWFPEHLQVAE